MKNKHIFIPLFVFLGAGLVSLIAATIDFKAVNPQLSYASTTIQFNYDGASDGYDPNGHSFDAVNFMTDDVVEAALTSSGLTGEKYNLESVKQYIAIENVVPKNIVKEINAYETILGGDATDTITSKDYHPVRYRFIVYQDLGVSQSKLNELVKNLADEYVAKFNEVYTNTLDKESFNELLNFDDYDYSYQTQMLSRKINVIMNYANELHARHNDFYVDNTSFKDLNAVGAQLIENLSSIDNIINLRSISKDPNRLRDYYNYQLEQLNNEKEKYSKDLTSVTTQFNNYEKDKTSYVGTGETIVTVSNNSAETYDALLAKKISLESTVASLTTEITRITDLRDRIDTVTQEEITNVENRISTVKTKYEQLENDFLSLLAKYNAKYVGEGSVTLSKVSYQSSSLFSASFIVRCIKIGMPIMLITMLGIAIYYLARTIRKEKRIV